MHAEATVEIVQTGHLAEAYGTGAGNAEQNMETHPMSETRQTNKPPPRRWARPPHSRAIAAGVGIVAVLAVGGIIAATRWTGDAGARVPADIVEATATAAATEVPCPPGKDGHTLVRKGTQCVDESPPTAAEQAADDAKSAYARAYQEFKGGRLDDAGLQRAIDTLAAATGNRVPWPVENRIADGAAGDGALGPYTVFQQINSYYCGPATVQTMLYYLAVTKSSAYWTSATYDTVTGAYDQLWGNSSHDQPIFANGFWLATETYGGTPWGAPYVPFTLNGWMGTTNQYVQRTTANIAGSTDLLWIIQSDVDSGYPVAENVLYDGNSYRPAGFNLGLDFQHWDTLYGYFWSSPDGQYHINQGQVYGNPWTPQQEFPLATIWTAVAQWQGVVW